MPGKPKYYRTEHGSDGALFCFGPEYVVAKLSHQVQVFFKSVDSSGICIDEALQRDLNRVGLRVVSSSSALGQALNLMRFQNQQPGNPPVMLVFSTTGEIVETWRSDSDDWDQLVARLEAFARSEVSR